MSLVVVVVVGLDWISLFFFPSCQPLGAINTQTDEMAHCFSLLVFVVSLSLFSLLFPFGPAGETTSDNNNKVRKYAIEEIIPFEFGQLG